MVAQAGCSHRPKTKNHRLPLYEIERGTGKRERESYTYIYIYSIPDLPIKEPNLLAIAFSLVAMAFPPPPASRRASHQRVRLHTWRSAQSSRSAASVGPSPSRPCWTHPVPTVRRERERGADPKQSRSDVRSGTRLVNVKELTKHVCGSCLLVIRMCGVCSMFTELFRNVSTALLGHELPWIESRDGALKTGWRKWRV